MVRGKFQERIRSPFVLVRDFVLVLVVVLVLESGRTEWWSTGVMEYWSIGVLEYWSGGAMECLVPSFSRTYPEGITGLSPGF